MPCIQLLYILLSISLSASVFLDLSLHLCLSLPLSLFLSSTQGFLSILAPMPPISPSQDGRLQACAARYGFLPVLYKVHFRGTVVGREVLHFLRIRVWKTAPWNKACSLPWPCLLEYSPSRLTTLPNSACLWVQRLLCAWEWLTNDASCPHT